MIVMVPQYPGSKRSKRNHAISTKVYLHDLPYLTVSCFVDALVMILSFCPN